MNNNIEIIESSLNRLINGESSVFFLIYDTKGNPRASIKYIYDLALTLRENGFDAKLLSEDNKYRGVSDWLGTKYDTIPVLSIKDDKIQIKIDDIVVIPEYYSNILQQLINIRCTKVMLVQQKEYIYETLPIGSKWIDYGFDKVITTTDNAKKYILEYFPESLVFVVPPVIEDIFVPSTEPIKPYVAISCRDRVIHKKFISEFYLRYPQLRWITFRDMVQMSYTDFANSLKECMVSVWIDDESTFGTFPLEAMKCGVPVVGKIPNTEPDWLGENGMWTYDTNKLVEVLGTYILAWLDGVELTDEVKTKMKETLLPYDKDVTLSNVVSIFNSLKNKRIESLQSALKKLKEEKQ